MPRRPQLDPEALEGLGVDFAEPIQKLGQGRGPRRAPEPAAPPPTAVGPGHPPPSAGTTTRARSPSTNAPMRRQQAGYIPADLNKQLMLLAVQLDRKKEHLVEDAVREYLERVDKAGLT